MIAPSAALLLTLALSAAAPAPEATDPLETFIADATGWLLEQGRLPSDYRLRLLAMEPADRVAALAHLRRMGLLTGAAWPVGDLLRPATPARKADE
ncbi:hypothetical protein [Paracoccus sp. NSM]|uniref:hypothetical protein n=1 Tax=Paracoccus sp. NSM TaxID=3457784 RepID=UPI0040370221